VLVYGVDFTSAPGDRKPLVVAQCRLDGAELEVTDLLRLRSFEQLERSLATPGSWVAGFDFPFGQPRRLVRALGWPESWEGAVGAVAAMSRAELEDLLEMYKAARPSGDKEHRRLADELAQSVSPMKLYGVPVAKMFFEGAPRLLASPAHLVPCRPTGDPRVALEAYPALVARALIGKRSYKRTSGKRMQAKADARRKMVRGLREGALDEAYGVRVRVGQFLADAMVEDEEADLLDAVFAAVQAAWAWGRRDDPAAPYGIPLEADALEGWIVDPVTLRRARSRRGPAAQTPGD